MESRDLAVLEADLAAQRVIIDSNLNRAVQVKPLLDKDLSRFLEVWRSLN